MKKNIIIVSVLTAALQLAMFGQGLVDPWSAATRGGSTAASGSLTLTSAVGQGNAGSPVASGGLDVEAGYIPGLRVFEGTTATMVQQEAQGWNMVSVPVIVSDYAKTALYPSAQSNAFYYAGAYAVAVTLQNGTGYWLQYTSSTPETISGTAFAVDTIQVLQNWNMFGPPSYPVLKTSVIANGTTIKSNFFGYQAGYGYLVVDTLKPGSAYWVQVSANGSLVIPSGGFTQTSTRSASTAQPGASAERPVSPLLSAKQAEEIKGFATITIRDASGHERYLYYDQGRGGIKLSGYILPPVAPDGLLDVRFASQRIVEVAGTSATDQTFPIQVTGGDFPLTVTWSGPSVRSGDKVVAIDEHGARKEYRLGGSKPITFADKSSAVGVRLIVSATGGEQLPKVFALYQNYPNPFNPTSTIRYDVPKASRVVLRVYNTLGDQVATLVDGEHDAGTYTVTFDGKNLASGVYFYRMEAGSTVITKKLVLMK